jgi:hypothetical protein
MELGAELGWGLTSEFTGRDLRLLETLADLAQGRYHVDAVYRAVRDLLGLPEIQDIAVWQVVAMTLLLENYQTVSPHAAPGRINPDLVHRHAAYLLGSLASPDTTRQVALLLHDSATAGADTTTFRAGHVREALLDAATRVLVQLRDGIPPMSPVTAEQLSRPLPALHDFAHEIGLDKAGAHGFAENTIRTRLHRLVGHLMLVDDPMRALSVERLADLTALEDVVNATGSRREPMLRRVDQLAHDVLQAPPEVPATPEERAYLLDLVPHARRLGRVTVESLRHAHQAAGLSPASNASAVQLEPRAPGNRPAGTNIELTEVVAQTPQPATIAEILNPGAPNQPAVSEPSEVGAQWERQFDLYPTEPAGAYTGPSMQAPVLGVREAHSTTSMEVERSSIAGADVRPPSVGAAQVDAVLDRLTAPRREPGEPVTEDHVRWLAEQIGPRHGTSRLEESLRSAGERRVHVRTLVELALQLPRSGPLTVQHLVDLRRLRELAKATRVNPAETAWDGISRLAQLVIGPALDDVEARVHVARLLALVRLAKVTGSKITVAGLERAWRVATAPLWRQVAPREAGLNVERRQALVRHLSASQRHRLHRWDSRAGALRPERRLTPSEWRDARQRTPGTSIPVEDAGAVTVRRMRLRQGAEEFQVTEVTVEIGLGLYVQASADDVRRAQAHILEAVDRYFNFQHVLSDGSQLHVRVEFHVSQERHAWTLHRGNRLPAANDYPDPRAAMPTDADHATYARQIARHLGLPLSGLFDSGHRIWSDGRPMVDAGGRLIADLVGLHDANLSAFDGWLSLTDLAPLTRTATSRQKAVPVGEESALDDSLVPVEVLRQLGDWPVGDSDPVSHALRLDAAHRFLGRPLRDAGDVRLVERVTEAATALFGDRPIGDVELRAVHLLATVFGYPGRALIEGGSLASVEELDEWIAGLLDDGAQQLANPDGAGPDDAASPPSYTTGPLQEVHERIGRLLGRPAGPATTWESGRLATVAADGLHVADVSAANLANLVRFAEYTGEVLSLRGAQLLPRHVSEQLHGPQEPADVQLLLTLFDDAGADAPPVTLTGFRDALGLFRESVPPGTPTPDAFRAWARTQVRSDGGGPVRRLAARHTLARILTNDHVTRLEEGAFRQWIRTGEVFGVDGRTDERWHTAFRLTDSLAVALGLADPDADTDPYTLRAVNELAAMARDLGEGRADPGTIIDRQTVEELAVVVLGDSDVASLFDLYARARALDRDSASGGPRRDYPANRLAAFAVVDAAAQAGTDVDWPNLSGLLDELERTPPTDRPTRFGLPTYDKAPAYSRDGGAEAVPAGTRYLDDPEAFKGALQDARAGRDRGEPIPYHAEDATSGLAAPGMGRAFGIELEADFEPHVRLPDVAERRRAIARDLLAAGLGRDDIVREQHKGDPDYTRERNGWRVVIDHTVGVELVSPILHDTQETWQDLRTVIAILTKHGGRATTQTGGHIHVGISDYGEGVAAHAKLLGYFEQFEDPLYRLAQNPDHTQHRGIDFAVPNRVAARGYRRLSDVRPSHHNNAINLIHAYGTDQDRVEFRLWDGTLDPGVIQAHVWLSVALTAAALRDAGLPVTSSPDPEPLGTHHARGAHDDRDADTASFRELLDTLPVNDALKRQAIALWARTGWQTNPDDDVPQVRESPPPRDASRTDREAWEEAADAVTVDDDPRGRDLVAELAFAMWRNAPVKAATVEYYGVDVVRKAWAELLARHAELVGTDQLTTTWDRLARTLPAAEDTSSPDAQVWKEAARRVIAERESTEDPPPRWIVPVSAVLAFARWRRDPTIEETMLRHVVEPGDVNEVAHKLNAAILNPGGGTTAQWLANSLAGYVLDLDEIAVRVLGTDGTQERLVELAGTVRAELDGRSVAEIERSAVGKMSQHHPVAEAARQIAVSNAWGDLLFSLDEAGTRRRDDVILRVSDVLHRHGEPAARLAAFVLMPPADRLRVRAGSPDEGAPPGIMATWEAAVDSLVGKWPGREKQIAQLAFMVWNNYSYDDIIRWSSEERLDSDEFQRMWSDVKASYQADQRHHLSSVHYPDSLAPFHNQQAGSLSKELATAKALGVRPVGPRDRAARSLLESGRLIWAILGDGTLVFAPRSVDGYGIHHPVLSDGEDVRAAGEAELFDVWDGYKGHINNRSGHFRPSEESLNYAREVFALYGIQVQTEPHTF